MYCTNMTGSRALAINPLTALLRKEERTSDCTSEMKSKKCKDLQETYGLIMRPESAHIDKAPINAFIYDVVHKKYMAQRAPKKRVFRCFLKKEIA